MALHSWPSEDPGEVRRRAYDLQRKGPRIGVQLRSAETAPGEVVAGLALIDTGATTTVVDIEALHELDLHPVNVGQIHTPAGIRRFPLFRAAEIRFVEAGIPPRRYPFVFGAPHMRQQGYLMLLGRDFLRTGLFIYDGSAGRWTVAWERSPREIEYQTGR